jgi:hypothetical protein
MLEESAKRSGNQLLSFEDAPFMLKIYSRLVHLGRASVRPFAAGMHSFLKVYVLD